MCAIYPTPARTACPGWAFQRECVHRRVCAFVCHVLLTLQTTTINMLTCSFAPSLGHAVVNGADTQLNAQRVRLSTGLCPQHDTLWEGVCAAAHPPPFLRREHQCGFVCFSRSLGRLGGCVALSVCPPPTHVSARVGTRRWCVARGC